MVEAHFIIPRDKAGTIESNAYRADRDISCWGLSQHIECADHFRAPSSQVRNELCQTRYQLQCTRILAEVPLANHPRLIA